jgi:hypothetical protein
MLVLEGACKDQRQVFVENFGYKVKVTQIRLRKAHELGLWLSWFGDHFNRDRTAWEKDLVRWAGHI